MGDAEQIEYCADLCRLAEACPFSDLTVQRVPRKKNPQIIRVERPFFLHYSYNNAVHLQRKIK
jgi:hypothetical protein